MMPRAPDTAELRSHCRTHCTGRRARRGMTLIEIMIGLTITALLMFFLVEWLLNTIRLRDETQAYTEAYAIGPTILGIITRDLQGVFVYQIAATTEEDPDSSDSSRHYFVGEDGGDDEDARDTLHFVTTVDSNLRIGKKQSDIAEVGYFLSENDRDDALEGTYILYRREDFHLDKEPTEGGKAIKVCERVVALDFKYFRRAESDYEEESLYALEDAEDYWDDADEDELPLAVQVTIWVDLSDASLKKKSLDERVEAGMVRRYRTVVLLPDYPNEDELAKLPSPGPSEENAPGENTPAGP